MARSGDVVESAATGEVITFVRTAADTGGELLELDACWTRPGHRAAPHVHPEMEERWRVVEGAAAFRVGELSLTAGPGELVVAPPGVPHVAWNPTAGEVRLRIEMRPALRWEEFVERLFALPPGDRTALARLAAAFPREIAAAPRGFAAGPAEPSGPSE